MELALASNVAALVNNILKVFGTKPKSSGSFAKGDIAKTYEEMMATATTLAAKEAKADIHLVVQNRVLADMEASEQGRPAESHTLLEEEFLRAFNQRREYHIVQMFRVMDLYAKSKSGGRGRP